VALGASYSLVYTNAAVYGIYAVHAGETYERVGVRGDGAGAL
jgi:hypothetical protein